MPHYLDKEPTSINNHLAPGDIDEDDPKTQAAMRKGIMPYDLINTTDRKKFLESKRGDPGFLKALWDHSMTWDGKPTILEYCINRSRKSVEYIDYRRYSSTI